MKVNGEIGIKSFLAVIGLVASATGSVGGVIAGKIGTDAEISALKKMDSEITVTLREIRVQANFGPAIDGKLDQVIKRFDAVERRLENLERMAMERVRPGP